MRIFNSFSGKKEDFVPVQEGKVSMYVCGPTVYDLGHLGHARSAIAFDVVRKYLSYKGFEVTFVSNYTDIDDKMIKRAQEEGVTVAELADRIIPEYQKDYGDLGVEASTVAPRATEYINGIVESVKKLEENGYAYLVEGDGVYFDVSKFADYGKLSNQDLEQLRAGERVAVNDQKRNAQDFALWKLKKEGEPFWTSPWGDGRPGWHIECSVMVKEVLGETIDIHGGGVDLKFPHHECEIAQHECATGSKFVNYWMHNGFVKVDSVKMSKSLGNFSTIRETLTKFKPKVVRLFLIQKHYRSPIDFTEEGLEQAQKSLMRIEDFLRKMKAVNGEALAGEMSLKVKAVLDEAKIKFEDSMDDDFETPGALAAVFGLIKSINTLMVSSDFNFTAADSQAVLDFITKVDQVLGVFHLAKEVISEEVEKLITEREAARQNKDWARSDELRDLLSKEHGIVVEDTPKGTLWKKI